GEVEAHRREALGEDRAEVDVVVLARLQMIDASADEIAAAGDRREIPGVAAVTAVRGVEVEERAIAISLDGIGVDLEHLSAERAGGEAHRLADGAADAAGADDQRRFDLAARRLDGRAVVAILDPEHAGPVDDAEPALLHDLGEP